MTAAVEEIRRAAALMRERAKAATPGPWELAEREFRRGTGTQIDLVTKRGVPIADDLTIDDHAHIASWHPAVALAVADWLDELASMADRSTDADQSSALYMQAPLAVARAYLGDQP